MLYLLEISGERKIRAFDTETDSELCWFEGDIIKLVKQCKMEFKNAIIEGNTIVATMWPNEMVYREPTDSWEYNEILLGQSGENKFKTVATNGNVFYQSSEKLKSRIRVGKISNCICSGYDDSIRDYTEYKSIDTYAINTDKEFKEAIDNEYKRFLVKSTLLGLDNRFDYVVEGQSVKLIAYRGESKKVILPSLVTSIAGYAFSYTDVEEVQLNMGLKFIGKKAFVGNNIKKIEIPETVEYIGQYAFIGNPGLMKIYKGNTCNINVINNELVKMSKGTVSFDSELITIK